MKKVKLFIIDVQNDFCWPGLANIPGTTLPPGINDFIPEEYLNQGSLYVPGAYDDSVRLAALIENEGDKFDDIIATLDSHHQLDIAHPMIMIDSNGKHPDPFTIVTEDDIDKGVWRAYVPSFQKHLKHYVSKLAENKRYPLCIWPPHCLIGTFGHNVVKPVREALAAWELKAKGYVEYITKGSNFTTEHYSAVKADVPDPKDPTTEMNDRLIGILDDSDIIVIAGQARSHCVANTIRDIASEFGSDSVKKMVLLEDAMSDVPGFEDLGEAFINDMVAMGVQVKTTENLFG